MKLHKITNEIVAGLSQKELYCYGYTASYMKELLEQFDIDDRIQGIVDDSLKIQTIHSVDGNTFRVYSEETLAKICLDNAAFIILSDYFQEAFDTLSQLLESIKYTQDIYYFENQETAFEMEYRKIYQNIPLENSILFRSGPHASSYVKGMDFSDNARALFEYMIANQYNEMYQLIWLVKDPKEFEYYAKIPNVQFLSFDWSASEEKDKRDQYYRALCLARYIFFTDAYGFARNCRGDQIRIQLWHGCGFKTRVNFVRCEKRYEYTTVISQIYAKIHQEVYGLRPNQMLVTGYAKQDWLFHPYEDWKKQLAIPVCKKYIFWMPTFRSAKEQLQQLDACTLKGQTGLPIVNTYLQMERLNILLQRWNIMLILKLHPFQDREKIGELDQTNIRVLDNELLIQHDIQINQLLGHADALISDYSSAAVDFMLLDRPIAFTLDDMEEYKKSRGFVFDEIRDWLPGQELFTFDDMCAFVEEIGKGVDTMKDRRQLLTSVMHQYQDDNNCKRIVEALQI